MDAPASIMTPTMLHQLKTPPMIDVAKKAMQELISLSTSENILLEQNRNQIARQRNKP
jgi:hypothetical protein